MKVIKGTEKTFAVNLECPGFDQFTDDFEIAVISGKTELKFYSNPEIPGDHLFLEDVVIPDDSSDSSSDSDSSDSGETTIQQWFCIVDTTNLPLGKVMVKATAHVPDANADGGIRDEITVEKLFDLVDM